MTNQPDFQMIHVTAENVAEVGVYCIKNKKAEGYQKKVAWFKSQLNQGLTIKIVTDSQGKQLGFIEYIPSELAWRPVKADNFLFIQCIALFGKDARRKNIGSALIQQCEADAKRMSRSGVCTMSSSGPWMANKKIFKKNEFTIADQKDRFELMSKKFNPLDPDPMFIDWTRERSKYKGWNLVCAHQCPWHEKSISVLKQSAKDHGIDLKVTILETPGEAQKAPSGFGTFSLLKDGKLLEDHYLSKTRFETILKTY